MVMVPDMTVIIGWCLFSCSNPKEDWLGRDSMEVTSLEEAVSVECS